jgi:hypothetical protein
MPLLVSHLVFQMSTLPDLDRLKWQSRVLVVFAPGEDDARLKRENELVEAQQDGFLERDLKVYRILGDAPDAERLRAKLEVEKKPFAVVLVGKDGSVKLRKSEPLHPDELFRVIDRMPMRKREMHNQ